MRVVVAEDELLMREGLHLVLDRAGIEVLATAVDLDDLLRKARAHRPDLVITDLRMPPTHSDEGLRAARALRKERPELAVVLLSHHVQPEYAMELLETGAGGAGYLLKQRIARTEEFGRDVHRVAAGGVVLDPEVATLIAIRAVPRDDVLTNRQREVLALMAEGRSNAAIADALSLTEKAVVAHASRIYEALGLPPSPQDHRRVLAVLRHLRST